MTFAVWLLVFVFVVYPVIWCGLWWWVRDVDRLMDDPEIDKMVNEIVDIAARL